MSISKQFKEKIIEEHGSSKKDTGSVNSQVAILTAEINALTNHININKKDFSSKRGLYQKVSQRKKLLNYLQQKDINKYRELIKKLDIRG